MTLRATELLAVAGEVAGALEGRRVQKVVQPDERTLLLGFAGAWLLVSVHRRFGRVHLLDGKPPGTGEAAPAFCMLARKELVGLALESVGAVAGERALGLAFAGAERRRRLLVFLYGAGARAVLVDEEGRALGAIGARVEPGAIVELPAPRTEDVAEQQSRFAMQQPSAAIAAHYERAESDERAAQVRAAALAAARQTIERLRRKERALMGDLERAEASAGRRRHADLLLAHLAEVPRGAREVTLPDDFSDGRAVTVALDPALSAKENASRIYRESKRRARGEAETRRRLDETRAAIAREEERLGSLRTAPDAALPSVAVRSAGARSGAKRAANQARPPYRLYRSASGAEILVGKGAEKNDELTFRVARGGDLFVHARDFPGSHVIVPLAGRAIDEQTLLDAATLALWFSGARPATDALADVQADVTYAYRKNVRKPRRAPPGRVSIGGGRTLRVRLEPERLRRLLASLADE